MSGGTKENIDWHLSCSLSAFHAFSHNCLLYRQYIRPIQPSTTSKVDTSLGQRTVRIQKDLGSDQFRKPSRFERVILTIAKSNRNIRMGHLILQSIVFCTRSKERGYTGSFSRVTQNQENPSRKLLQCPAEALLSIGLIIVAEL